MKNFNLTTLLKPLSEIVWETKGSSQNTSLPSSKTQNKYSINSQSKVKEILDCVQVGENTPMDFSLDEDNDAENKEVMENGSWQCNNTPVAKYHNGKLTYYIKHLKLNNGTIINFIVPGEYLSGNSYDTEDIKEENKIDKQIYEKTLQKPYTNTNLVKVITRRKYIIPSNPVMRFIKDDFKLEYYPNVFCITKTIDYNENEIIKMGESTKFPGFYLYALIDHKKIIKQFGVWDESGKGRKQCLDCQKYVGCASYTCGNCGGNNFKQKEQKSVKKIIKYKEPTPKDILDLAKLGITYV